MSNPRKVRQTEVLICGSGSAGLMAALWLAKYNIPFLILEARDGPLVVGKADGVQCRTVEIFESFGISEELLRESYHVLEIAFWGPDGNTGLDADGKDGEGGGGGIKRSHFAPDKEPGLSHQPHVILSQTRINELITNEMLRCGGTNVEYGHEVINVKVDSEEADDPDAYPVTVAARKDGMEVLFRAKYALGCDGAHSAVRKSLGFSMLGDSTNAIWGVADIFPRTTFPDIRKKSVLQSTSGTLMIIPREGDEISRFYIEFPPGTIASEITEKDIHDRARLIFRPYELEIAETRWWSAYAIGQRLANHFHERFRVFLTGDACHTHSPKAGQGMNLSLQDGYNIGWKLGAYLSGQASEDLVRTYVSERQKTATELIDFDRKWTQIFKSSGRGDAAGHDSNLVRDAFVKAGRYTAGQAYRYDKNIIVWPSQGHDTQMAVAKTSPVSNAETGPQLVVGMRLPSAQVVRYSDARVFQLLSVIKSDCRWRILVFDGDVQQKTIQSRLEDVGRKLEMLIQEFTPDGADPDSLIEPLLVLKAERTNIELVQIPEVFKPVTGKYRIRSLHKVFVDDMSYNSGHGHAFDTLGVGTSETTIVVVRPDQFISMVIPGAEVDALGSFFRGFMIKRASSISSQVKPQ
ncbi:hypothetical protein M406DRAFT_341274 [Cryphonectria parasitica EP155]|uniref:Phenol 2-monooxygenase n=1 Tax=Cryphonectria parasitica (strain ATCC 38755 / EP155) TaxID=660469 RepID=A0A9P5CM08_CRYP1|nr:uncharacterized protein M406DRAFT_341274 [Cryphonectria parasitica EP155]KAF3763879.1 hypothetical protein M406DRAFT_341274 [Cryphonectria parasitica EP155]